MKWTMADVERLPKEARDQVYNQLARASSNVEPRHSYAGEGTNRVDPMVTPCRVRIHSKRKRLGDAVEGYCGKPCIDGVVRSGLLPDDSGKYIPQPAEQTHELSEVEETIITIETVEE